MDPGHTRPTYLLDIPWRPGIPGLPEGAVSQFLRYLINLTMFAFVLKFLLFFCNISRYQNGFGGNIQADGREFFKGDQPNPLQWGPQGGLWALQAGLDKDDSSQTTQIYTVVTTIDLSPLFAYCIHIPVTFLSIDFIITARPPRVTATQQDPGCWTWRGKRSGTAGTARREWQSKHWYCICVFTDIKPD